MSERAPLLLPLASSLIYVLGALLVRRAADLGVGVWRTTFISNSLSAFLFAPLTLLGGPGQPLAMFWQPVVLATLLVAGQTAGFVALTRGDVTVATPVLGLKTVLVAWLTAWLLATRLPFTLWLAAGLSSGAIALLSGSGAGRRGRVAISLGAGSVAAAAFALFDVLVQKWAPVWGAGRLLPLVMALGGVLSGAFVPLFRAPLRAIPTAAWRPLLVGSACISVQGILLITTVGVWGHATSVNIVYSVRSLWMVAAVWGVGHWFQNAEQHLGHGVLGRRLTGALLMTVAVMLALV